MNVTVLYQIEVFRAVMKTGSMTGAAHLLNLSQPSVTKHIQALEARLNAKLFVKEGRLLRPTSVATLLQDEAELMLSQANKIERIVESFSRAAKTTLRIGVPPILSSNFLIAVLDKLSRDRSEYDLQVIVKDSQLLKSLASSGHLDIAIVVDQVYRTELNIGKSPLVCVMSVDHPLTSRSHIEFTDLLEHDYVGFEKESPMQMVVDAAARDLNIKISPRVVVSTTPTMLDLVSYGMGVCIVHPFAVFSSTAAVAVRRFEPQIMWEYKVIYSTTMNNSALVRAFVSAISEVSDDWSQQFYSPLQQWPDFRRTSRTPISHEITHRNRKAIR